ncbi:hypothetical protein MZO28_00225 (plasmid) [Enterococcus faecalis]|uniref:Uncharacterized protein n=2 Tax=Bacilli TaxID=91061 RepID=A0AAW8UAJ8_9ENTE|nr:MULTISPECIES: hypothetical protein [Bacilli]MCV3110730.1 hypothetical protein [Enterococcus hirae]MCT2553928.1 hypothetical protein [Staphylococcus aureus]MCT2575262.1 hypothetical protein [Staphylococcus aureus]MCT9927257.1 hypothetical protein [Enterococcus faecalis]MCV3127291.1 hypothetical protein [Enterococcus faecalis]
MIVMLPEVVLPAEQNYYDLYEKLLPGCQFHKMGWAMGVVWTK